MLSGPQIGTQGGLQMPAEPRWLAILEGDCALLGMEEPPDRSQFAAALVKSCLEPLRLKIASEVGALVEQDKFSEAYQAFEKIIQFSRVGPRVMLAVRYVEGSSEWFCDLIKLGQHLRYSSEEQVVQPAHKQEILEVLTAATRPVRLYQQMVAQRNESTRVFSVAAFDPNTMAQVAGLGAERKQQLRGIFAGNLLGVAKRLFGAECLSGELSDSARLLNAVREGDHEQALALLREAVRAEGLHIRINGLVPLLPQAGFDWVLAVQGLANACVDKEPLEQIRRCAGELLAATRAGVRAGNATLCGTERPAP